MYFVCKIIASGDNKSIESNVRMGGYKHLKTAERAAKNNAFALLRDHSREIVGQTINPTLPRFIQ